jgi:hypothetical protein
MATAQFIKQRVESFYRDHGAVGRLEDAFGPWFLHSRFRLPSQQAFAQASDGPNDSGIDAFHLEERDGELTLHLIQAKYSESSPVVRKGIEDLGRAATTLRKLATTGDSELAAEHAVIQKLRHALSARDASWSDHLQLRLYLVHLIRDQEVWLTSSSVDRTKRELTRRLEDGIFAGRAAIEFVGPDEMETAEVVSKHAPSATIRFEGQTIEIGPDERVLFGFGRLADFVQLHELYQHDLFAKNVRYFLHREASKDRSASSQIRQALELIVEAKRSPEHFALVHNGITVTAPKARADLEQAGLLHLEPGSTGVYVLNGCQTVYTAWRFFKDRSKRDVTAAWKEKFDQIRIPVRVVITRNEERIREVTIGANRQTSIDPSAFYANDLTQLRLEKNFGRLKIFYERQKGAWEHLSRADSSRAAEFVNGVVELENLARAIAGASRTLPIDLAKSPRRIFDTQEQYRRVFSEKHLQSVRLQLFLYNAFGATKSSLRDLVGNVGKLEGIKPANFSVPVFRLLVLWIAKHEPDLVTQFAGRVYHPSSEIRDEFGALLKHQRSGIQQVLFDVWWQDGEWAEPIAKDRLQAAISKLRLDGVDVFERFRDLDTEMGEDGSLGATG